MNIVAVFSHPDDELGCIGTLAKHARRGDRVDLVWTTHGELASQFVAVADEEVRRVRREHGAWVAAKIGASCHFFDMGDSRMRGDRDEALALARLYARLKPDAVLTWSDDHPHPDHRMTAKIAFDAVTLARIPKILEEGRPEGALPPEAHRRPVQFFQYPSAGSHRPLMHVDISDEIEVVREAFDFYRSFFDWSFSAEAFVATRAALGREAGVRFAEKLQRRRSFAPAVPYLDQDPGNP